MCHKNKKAQSNFDGKVLLENSLKIISKNTGSSDPLKDQTSLNTATQMYRQITERSLLNTVTPALTMTEPGSQCLATVVPDWRFND